MVRVLLPAFLCAVICFSPQASALPGTAGEAVSCSVEPFPGSIRSQLKDDLVSWKVQQREDLSKNTRGRWESEKPLQCPGIAIGRFEGGDASAYAVLLVPRNRSTAGFRFLIFAPTDGASTYIRRVLEQSSDSAAENFFIRSIEIRKFFDAASKAKFHVRTSDGILMVDAGESEYETDIYFWANGQYEHQAVDY